MGAPLDRRGPAGAPIRGLPQPLPARRGELRLRRTASSPRDVEEHIETTQNFLDAQDWDRATGIGTSVADFLSRHSNLRRLSFAAQAPSVLPPEHHDYYLFVDHEGESLLALGFTSQALDRYLSLVDAFTHRAQSEPGRADYQRDLSISYQRLGICFMQLDRVEEAATALERHLQLALDVYQRMPGQVDAVVDPAIALHLTAGLDDHGEERSQQARELLELLESDQRLPHHGKALLDELRQGQGSSRREA